MPIEVSQCQIQITTRELGLTRDRFTKGILRQVLEGKISSVDWQDSQRPSPNLADINRAIADFGERLAAGATQNVETYFARLPASGYTKGGKPMTSKPLLYLKSRLLPSNEDVGAIGEGIAGYYLENIEGLEFELRPFGVSPDFYFRDPGARRKILVEVKSSLQQGRVSLTTAISLIEIMAKTKFIRAGRYAAYVIQVNISRPWDFELWRLSIEEV